MTMTNRQQKQYDEIKANLKQKLAESGLFEDAAGIREVLEELAEDTIELTAILIADPDRQPDWEKEKLHLISRYKGIRALAERQAIEKIFGFVVDMIPNDLFPSGRIKDFLKI